jgi:hypothetical protein
MKHFKARLLALCALMVLIAAALAPMAAAQAYGPGCPDIIINCGPFYGPHNCVGTRVGQTCVYKASCLTCPS